MMRIKKLFCLALFLTTGFFYSQSKAQREDIKKTNDENQLEKIRITRQSEFDIDEKRVKIYLIKNPDVKRTQIRDGKIYYIKSIDEDGNPVYITIKKKQVAENACKSRLKFK